MIDQTTSLFQSQMSPQQEFNMQPMTFRCPYNMSCPAIVENEYNLNNHLLIEHGHTTFPCQICGIILKNPIEHSKHIKAHNFVASKV